MFIIDQSRAYLRSEECVQPSASCRAQSKAHICVTIIWYCLEEHASIVDIKMLNLNPTEGVHVENVITPVFFEFFARDILRHTKSRFFFYANCRKATLDTKKQTPQTPFLRPNQSLCTFPQLLCNYRATIVQLSCNYRAIVVQLSRNYRAADFANFCKWPSLVIFPLFLCAYCDIKSRLKFVLCPFSTRHPQSDVPCFTLVLCFLLLQCLAAKCLPASVACIASMLSFVVFLGRFLDKACSCSECTAVAATQLRMRMRRSPRIR